MSITTFLKSFYQQNLGLNKIEAVSYLTSVFTRRLRLVSIITADIAVIFLSLYASLAVTSQISFAKSFSTISITLSGTAIITIATMRRVGLYRAFFKYISSIVIKKITIVCIISSIVLFTFLNFYGSADTLNTSITYFTFLFFGTSGNRYCLRQIYRIARKGPINKIAIYGAGAAGNQALNWIRYNENYEVLFFIDDDREKIGLELHGKSIKSADDAIEEFKSHKIDLVLLAMPNLGRIRKQEIIALLTENYIPVKTVPSIENLLGNPVDPVEFQDLTIEDLLGREESAPNNQNVHSSINGSNILVSGAGGSIGSELCREIIRHEPKVIVLLDVSEKAVYDILLELENCGTKVKLLPCIGSVNDNTFVDSCIKKYNVDTVYHAAAYKHVPLMEQNKLQALKNNTIGTLTILNAAIKFKVKNFTLISTDKAVKPTNIMGASKRLAELICLAKMKQCGETKITIVRFGNVLGSSGSVVPLFRKQIKEGGPVTLTDQNVTRYFMTISEASGLVVQASSISKGGQIFVLEMGAPVKILDLAKKMILLTGNIPVLAANNVHSHRQSPNIIEIKQVGMRPGEKLHEELSYSGDLLSTINPKILLLNEKIDEQIYEKDFIANISNAALGQDVEALSYALKKFVNYSQDL